MNICVTATGKDLNAQVDPRFGRCQYFIIVNSDTMKFESLLNGSISAPGGAGIQAAQTIANKVVDVLITGNVGPNAFKTLSASNIKIITGASGTVKDVIEMYKNDKFSETKTATVEEHSGIGGHGHGSIGTQGPGKGRGRDQIAVQKPPKNEEEVHMINDKIDQLDNELKEIKNRLEKLNE